ncbi:DUF3024 domain-containing protein [Arthrobacter sp. UYCu723]
MLTGTLICPLVVSSSSGPTVTVWLSPLRGASGIIGSMVSSGLPELDVARARRWCAERVPARFSDEMRVECDVAARHITILECRPPWDENG